MSYPRFKGGRMQMITVYLPKGVLKRIDNLVPDVYPSRAELIRLAVNDLLKGEKKAK